MSLADRLSRSLALLGDRRLGACVVTRPHPLVALIARGPVVVALTVAEVWDGAPRILSPLHERLADARALVVLLGDPARLDLQMAQSRGVVAVLPALPTADQLLVGVESAFDLLESKARSERRGQWIERYRYELGELFEIARAITTEREVRKLLALILEKSRFLLGADAGSLYVVEGDDIDLHKRTLRFKLSQNESVAFDSREFTMPVSARSMAGYVALHRTPLRIDDAYALPPGSPFGFDRSFDEKTGYRTKSMLTMPMLSRTGETIGVIQLINKKRVPQRRLRSAADVDDNVVTFDQRSNDILSALASQAGIALENAILYDDIQRMLEGFVRASVEAIEQRDPTTSGHSRRVADLTLGLAQAVERSNADPFEAVRWSREELKELEYASLLHDFGKIGVREQVLVKAKKLFPHELALVRARFGMAMQAVTIDALRRELSLRERGAPRGELSALEDEARERRRELAAGLAAVEAANEPTVLSVSDFRRIEAVAGDTFVGLDGEVVPLLSPAEVSCLCIPRGSLTPTELEEIRRHVAHTFEFLSRVPWGRQFRRVPQIARSHHERINGTGYPARLKGEEIPLQSRMMSISDIFDALTASDRPYKRAVPLHAALDILALEVKDQHLDGELVRIFVEAKVWESPKG
jgi:HD-GYP domain-containing protein (c-di-GMP phosphodiesterase class II)